MNKDKTLQKIFRDSGLKELSGILVSDDVADAVVLTLDKKGMLRILTAGDMNMAEILGHLTIAEKMVIGMTLDYEDDEDEE